MAETTQERKTFHGLKGSEVAYEVVVSCAPGYDSEGNAAQDEMIGSPIASRRNSEAGDGDNIVESHVPDATT